MKEERRILPILLFVITLSIPLMVLTLPSEFQQYSWQTQKVYFLYLSFILEGDSYWAARSILKPFLHTGHKIRRAILSLHAIALTIHHKSKTETD